MRYFSRREELPPGRYIALDKVILKKDWWTIWYYLCTGKFINETAHSNELQ